MAYCKKCGAYIPDGQTQCLACGYDEEAERKAAENSRNRSERFGGGFAAEEYNAEKRETERRRREEEKKHREYERDRREEERRAEYEQRRREKQEQDRQWAEQEYQRRQQAQTEYSYYDRNNSKQKSGPMRHKAMAVMSYFSVLFILPLLLCKDDKFAVYHAKQGVVLFLFGILADIIASVFPVGFILSIFRIYLMIKGIGNAAHDKMEPLPYIGKFGER